MKSAVDAAEQRPGECKVPLENEDVRPAPALGDVVQERPEFVRHAWVGARVVGGQLDAGVEIPADQQHRVPGAQDGGLGRGEVGGGVEDDRDPPGPRYPPAGPARLDDRAAIRSSRNSAVGSHARVISGSSVG